MTYVVFFTIILLITLLGVFLTIESNKKKAILLKKQNFTERQNHAISHFKTQISQFIEAKILRPKHGQNLQAIAGNFFVVQAHNEDNLLILESTLENLINTLNSELAKANISNDKETIANKILDFIQELPTSARDYHNEFYTQIMPALIVTLKTPDLVIEDEAAEDPLLTPENELEKD
ncbi:hypothetical protein [Pseudoalteromonas denitrificans]|uniref:Uncharacterized protein n=1 Tax=Pseudoalteromonas denitrificans DSM 6059 TaxID=1123010 RepID=A0A1I1N9E3_9GAMM|nr:hypothetical protein [Pseudoalteromonas denitrificans]SFC93986.1 hypothetical protein SAMN02745724_02977 [Pseudoalteromonas denitrificans DSM 6059]